MARARRCSALSQTALASNRRREKDTRAGIFIGHLLWFRHGIAREAPDNKVGIWNAYIARVLTYHAELGKIRRDFLGNREFLELTDALGNLHEADIFTYTGFDSRDPICSRIDRLGQIIERPGRRVEVVDCLYSAARLPNGYGQIWEPTLELPCSD